MKIRKQKYEKNKSFLSHISQLDTKNEKDPFHRNDFDGGKIMSTWLNFFQVK